MGRSTNLCILDGVGTLFIRVVALGSILCFHQALSDATPKNVDRIACNRSASATQVIMQIASVHTCSRSASRAPALTHPDQARRLLRVCRRAAPTPGPVLASDLSEIALLAGIAHNGRERGDGREYTCTYRRIRCVRATATEHGAERLHRSSLPQHEQPLTTRAIHLEPQVVFQRGASSQKGLLDGALYNRSRPRSRDFATRSQRPRMLLADRPKKASRCKGRVY